LLSEETKFTPAQLSERKKTIRESKKKARAAKYARNSKKALAKDEKE
jgi:predicted nucleotidyltransferase